MPSSNIPTQGHESAVVLVAVWFLRVVVEVGVGGELVVELDSSAAGLLSQLVGVPCIMVGRQSRGAVALTLAHSFLVVHTPQHQLHDRQHGAQAVGDLSEHCIIMVIN
jgi:hypothetical protein